MSDSPVRDHNALNLTPVAPPNADAVIRGKRADSAYADAIAQVHAQHPALSPWFALPGDDDATQAKALRQIRAAAKALNRRVLTGTHATTKQPVWALGGEPLARKPRGTAKNPSISADVEAGPTDQVEPAKAAAGGRRR